MPRRREPAFCAFCGADMRRGQRISPHPALRFCSRACKLAEKESRGALSRVRSWLRARLALALISPPPPEAVRKFIARPGFGRSPIAINDLRNASEEQIEDARAEEVAEL